MFNQPYQYLSADRSLVEDSFSDVPFNFPQKQQPEYHSRQKDWLF